VQLKIDALKEAAAWPDADRRTPVVLASQFMAAELYQEGFEYFAARSDRVPADALWLALAGAWQRAGYRHPGGEGVEHFTPAELAAAADLLGGGTAAAFAAAGAELTRRGEHALALRILDLGLVSHPGTAELLDLRQGVLLRLVERHQLLNPFKFVYYAGLANLELASAG
jgi:hypothetical protein